MTDPGQWAASHLPRLDGQVAIVTGANSGIGLHTARLLAGLGSTVVVACRDPRRGGAAADIVIGEGGSAEAAELDLSDLSSVAGFAQWAGRHFDAIDMLVNNAGVMAIPRMLTVDGFEQQLGVNHLGHFALTQHLLPQLQAAARPRVVTVSSFLAHRARICFKDLQGDESYDPWAAYAQSKLACLLFAQELARRPPAPGKRQVVSVAVHPGYSATSLVANGPATFSVTTERLLLRLGNAVVAQPAAAGALPSVAAAAGLGASGDYLGPGGPLHLRGRPARLRLPRAAGNGDARRLWDVSVELTSRGSMTGITNLPEEPPPSGWGTGARWETPRMHPKEMIGTLGLRPHPEGGWYAETWRDRDGAGSAIYFLLIGGQPSQWHRVHDRAEAWHHYAGDPVRLHVSPCPPQLVGPDLRADQRPQAIVPPGAWQRAESIGEWSLVGCTVTPAYDAAAFELAPPGWAPGSDGPRPSTVGTMVTTPAKSPAARTPTSSHNTLSIDIGGTGLKASVLDDSGAFEHDSVRVDTPYPLPPDKLVTVLADLVRSLPDFDRVSVGFPGMVRGGHVLSAPHFVSPQGPEGEPTAKLVKAWARYNLQASISHALGKPTRVANDADMQGSAVVTGEGLELVVTLGTGVGSAMFFQGDLLPHIELAHHPLRKDLTYNEVLGDAARKHDGHKKWNRRVEEAIAVLRALTFFDHCFIGGGNSAKIEVTLPGDVSLVDNSAGIAGGLKLWARTA